MPSEREGEYTPESGILRPALRGTPRLPDCWQARLSAWPGLVAFLSVLAVFFSQQQERPELHRVTVAPVSPALPELRPLPPQPAPTPLLGSPPAQVLQLAQPIETGSESLWAWTFQLPRPELSWWGRSQTDGG